MDVIELEKWVPSRKDPRRMEYVGQPIAAEVFEKLMYRLENTGYLPDGYFILDSEWEDGREIPEGAGLFVTTDYGCEGIYLDVYLKWYENGKPVTKSFIQGKTPGENGNDLDRMFLISSEITKAFHGYNADRSRYDDNQDMGGSVIHLSQAEEKTIIGALMEQRERQAEAMSQTEQLLRRMTGNITAYIDLMGQKPLHLSDYDRAVLAIRDGELETFENLLEQIYKQIDRDGLLIEAAGRPGEVGRKMTMLLLKEQSMFSASAYETACKRALDIADPEKVGFLVEQAAEHTNGLTAAFYGELVCEAYSSRKHAIAQRVVEAHRPGQNAVISDTLLQSVVENNDMVFFDKLVQNGFVMTDSPAWLIMSTRLRDSWMVEHMLDKGIQFDPEDYAAMSVCIQQGYVAIGKKLMDLGLDFDAYREHFQGESELTETDTFKELAMHWEGTHGMEPEQGQSM